MTIIANAATAAARPKVSAVHCHYHASEAQIYDALVRATAPFAALATPPLGRRYHSALIMGVDTFHSTRIPVQSYRKLFIY